MLRIFFGMLYTMNPRENQTLAIAALGGANRM